jgi:hypothetical protein
MDRRVHLGTRNISLQLLVREESLARSGESGEEAWSVILGIIMILLKDFFARNIEKFQKASGLNTFCTGLGFPEGDLRGKNLDE